MAFLWRANFSCEWCKVTAVNDPPVDICPFWQLENRNSIITMWTIPLHNFSVGDTLFCSYCCCAWYCHLCTKIFIYEWYMSLTNLPSSISAGLSLMLSWLCPRKTTHLIQWYKIQTITHVRRTKKNRNKLTLYIKVWLYKMKNAKAIIEHHNCVRIKVKSSCSTDCWCPCSSFR